MVLCGRVFRLLPSCSNSHVDISLSCLHLKMHIACLILNNAHHKEFCVLDRDVVVYMKSLKDGCTVSSPFGLAHIL